MNQVMAPSESGRNASALHSRYEELSQLISKQWRRTLTAQIIAAIFLVAMLALGLWLKGSSPNVHLLKELRTSTKAMNTLAQAMHSGCMTNSEKTDKRCADALTLLDRYDQQQQQAQEALKTQDEQPSAVALSLTQIVGGTAILAILGYLGLVRLNNLDQEMSNMRSFMFEQIKARSEETKVVIAHDIISQVKNEIEVSVKSMHQSTSNAVQQISDTAREATEAAQGAMESIESVQVTLENKLAQYPWLQNEKMRDTLAALSDTPSVQKAHELSEQLRDTDPVASIAALRAIIEHKLFGDKEDFHNAHAEAMRQRYPELGLRIAERGLDCFDDDYDLIADKAKALLSLGRIDEAKDLLEDFRLRDPEQFARGWRPMEFYANIVESSGLNDAKISELDVIFGEVTSRAPHLSRTLASHARFLLNVHRYDRAEEVLTQSLERNPFSQQLLYIYGQLLLARGRPHEAVHHLERAVKTDFQEQFQSDISQSAVYCMLAQAYEAADMSDKARPIYMFLSNTPNAIGFYSQQRLIAIDIMSGNSPEIDQGANLSELLSLLKAKASISQEEGGDERSDTEPHDFS